MRSSISFQCCSLCHVPLCTLCTLLITSSNGEQMPYKRAAVSQCVQHRKHDGTSWTNCSALPGMCSLLQTVISNLHRCCRFTFSPVQINMVCTFACKCSFCNLSTSCCAEGKKSNIVVMGEKGRAQLVRVERDRILSTMNDINKMRITFSQVFAHLSSALQQQSSSSSSALQTVYTQMQCTASCHKHKVSHDWNRLALSPTCSLCFNA